MVISHSSFLSLICCHFSRNILVKVQTPSQMKTECIEIDGKSWISWKSCMFLGHLLKDDLINPVKMSVRPSTIKLNAATNQIVISVKVDKTFTMIWLSRSSEVRVKVRRWPQSPIGTILHGRQPILRKFSRPGYRKLETDLICDILATSPPPLRMKEHRH